MPKTAQWDGFEYERVQGPYEKKREGAPPQWQINLCRKGIKPKTITRSSKAIIDDIEADVRGRLAGKKKRTRARKHDGASVPRAAGGDSGGLDYEAELQALAAALREAKTADQVDIIKRKADALKTVRALQSALPPKEEEDPTEKMTMEELLDAAAEHLRRHGYKVTNDDTERRKAGHQEDQPVLPGGSEGQTQ